jgi:hypothetical protein
MKLERVLSVPNVHDGYVRAGVWYMDDLVHKVSRFAFIHIIILHNIPLIP